MDRISILPEDILHNIMSRLNHREAVCTVVLSKSWRQTFSTFPYLVLHENHDAFIRSKQTNFFYDFVDNSLLRCYILHCIVMITTETTLSFSLMSTMLIGEIEIMEIEIDAPSLQNFYYCGPDLDWGAETKFKMDKCVNLNELSLAKLNITEGEWFLRHHLFPLMHTLELREVLCEALMSRKSKEKCFCSSSRDMNCWWDDYEEVNSTLSSSGFFKKILTVFSNNLKQFLFESLIMRSRHVKCWWHDLKEVKVTCSFGIDGKEITVDWKNFLYAFPNLTEGNVSFVLG
ncbi:hypothetical protein RIF29_40899 [Crotalaria pallida]|uniref:F-box domain-containing protein n=1 Tax=Crotalaria pallida TaxID=3830 RepID=A0AAN9E6C2_CROPI